MAKVLLIFAHPALEKSRIHAQLLRQLPRHPGFTFHDLYQHYPHFEIDVEREQHLLMMHDIIILQHPFYWYSAPALVKQWLDLVLEHNWAYGARGRKLEGKHLLSIISTGGTAQAYSPGGRNRFTIRTLLTPFEQTAHLCRMEYWPPFVVHGTHKLEQADIVLQAHAYGQLLTALLSDRISKQERDSVQYLQDLLPIPDAIQS